MSHVPSRPAQAHTRVVRPRVVRTALLAASAALLTVSTACGGSETTASTTSTSKPPTSTAAVPSLPAKVGAAGGVYKYGEAAAVQGTDPGPSTPFSANVMVTLEEGKAADLQGIDLDAQSKASVPYYLRYTAANVGTTAVSAASVDVHFTVLNEAGDAASKLLPLGRFEKCRSVKPDQFRPGDTFSGCRIYMIPVGQKATSVIFDGVAPKTTWRG